MSYETLRGFADSWGLILLAILFALMLLFIFRRGSTAKYRDAARIPMEVDERPDLKGQSVTKPGSAPKSDSEGHHS